MKFKSKVSVISNYLSNTLLDSNSLTPVLEYFKFSLNGNNLQIVSTNNETTIISEIQVEGKEDGIGLFHKNIVSKTLKTLKSDSEVEISFNKKNQVNIKCEGSNFKSPGEDPETFIKIPEIEKLNGLTVNAELYKSALLSALSCSSNDMIVKQKFCSVYHELKKDNLILCSSDLYRISKNEIDVSNDLEANYLVPNKALNTVKNLIPNKGDIELSFSEKHISLFYDNQEIIITLMANRFPDYEKVMPTSAPIGSFESHTSNIKPVINRASIYSDNITGEVKFELNGKVNIMANCNSHSLESKEYVKDVNYSGEKLNIAFNSDLLLSMLSNTGSDKLRFEFHGSNKPLIIKSCEHDRTTMMISPVYDKSEETE